MSSALAAKGGAPVRTKPFPSWPVWGKEEEQALLQVLHSGKWGSTAGTVVRDFEESFAAFQDARYGICVSNGTLALVAALKAVGVGPGDEVIVPPYTFIASASAVVMLGAIPVFVDIQPDTLLIDPTLVEAAVTPRTKAILAVHIAGCPCDMDALTAVARKHNLRLIEDAAQAVGAVWNGRKVGAIGDLGTFSFQSSKNLNSGEGGIIIGDDEALTNMVWSMVNVGRVKGGAWYQHEHIGWNLRVTEFQGALLNAQFQRLPDQIARREANGQYLTRRMAEIPGISATRRDPRVTTHAWHLFMFRFIPSLYRMTKTEFLDALRAEGIPCAPGYVSLNKNGALLRDMAQILGRESVAPTRCPVSEACEDDVIWLTQNVLLGTQEDMDDIVNALAKIAADRGL